MAMYSLNLMRIALESWPSTITSCARQDVGVKFFEHFLHIAEG